jgi:hypothetical protein
MLQSANFGLTECQCGVVLNFPNPSGNIPKKDEYFLYFSVESSLPKDVPSNIVLSPNNYVLAGDNNFIPTVITKVQSVHRGETQSLIKLTIKDRFDQTLHTDYVKLVCSPTASENIQGRILSDSSDNIGPNGGSLMSVSSTRTLDIGMQITGQFITEPTYIVGIESEFQIELSRVITNVQDNNRLFNYVFTRTTSCIDTDALRFRENQSEYIFLNKDNNWTYLVNGQLILQFIRANLQDDTIVVRVPAKNKSIFPDNTKKADLPGVAMIYATGRVDKDQYCIT